MNWFLIGFSGCGKTTLGKRLAESLGYDFTDLDTLIEQREKQTIADIFEKKGEQYFRNCESFYLKHMPVSDNRIIATGGGTPCFNDNLEWMKLNGKLIYLKTDELTLYKRLAPIKDERPLFKKISLDDLKSHITASIRDRETFYLKADELITLPGDEEVAIKLLSVIICRPEKA